jgi:Family of unknown function (DUF6600)
MLTYISNSTNVYHLSSDQIVYLNDLGISSEVMKALIERDNTPESERRKQQEVSATPLPPEAALTKPATDIYPATEPKSNIIQVPKFPEGTQAYEPASAQVAPPADTGAATVYEPAPDTVDSQVSYFYSGLSPYGAWYNTPEYGYCWQPTVAVVNGYWRPYTDHGRWLWSSAGWYWYSDYTWGWAPFHYGRWAVYPKLGWIWVPDSVWGPSWVSWRYSNYYCGWAPLPPRCDYVYGSGLFYNGLSVGFGFDFGFSYHYYTFIPLNRFCDRRPYHYYVSHDHAKSIFRDSRVANRYILGANKGIVNEGMGLNPIAKVTRGDIPTVRVREASRTLGPTGMRERLRTEGNSLIMDRPPSPSQIQRSVAPTSRARRAGTPLEASAGAREEPSASPTVSGAPAPAALSGPNTVSRSGRTGNGQTRVNASGRSERITRGSGQADLPESSATVSSGGTSASPSQTSVSGVSGRNSFRPQDGRATVNDLGGPLNPPAAKPDGSTVSPGNSRRSRSLSGTTREPIIINKSTVNGPATPADSPTPAISNGNRSSGRSLTRPQFDRNNAGNSTTFRSRSSYSTPSVASPNESSPGYVAPPPVRVNPPPFPGSSRSLRNPSEPSRTVPVQPDAGGNPSRGIISRPTSPPAGGSRSNPRFSNPAPVQSAPANRSTGGEGRSRTRGSDRSSRSIRSSQSSAGISGSFGRPSIQTRPTISLPPPRISSPPPRISSPAPARIAPAPSVNHNAIRRSAESFSPRSRSTFSPSISTPPRISSPPPRISSPAPARIAPAPSVNHNAIRRSTESFSPRSRSAPSPSISRPSPSRGNSPSPRASSSGGGSSRSNRSSGRGRR